MLGEDWREAYIDFIQDQKLLVGVDARSAEAARVMRRSQAHARSGYRFHI
jgi:hypothetical protein